MYFKKSFLWCIVLAVIIHFESRGSYAVNIVLTANQYFGGNVAPTLTCSPPSDSDCDNPMWFFEETLLSTCVCSDKYQATSNPFNMRSTLRINNAGPEDTGMYHCEFECSGETFASNMFKITYVAPVSFTTPDSISYYEYINNTISLQCSPVDYDNHQWQTTKLVPVQLGGRFGLTGANNTDLIITELQLDDARTYVCTANNKVTIKAEIRAHLFVYKFPEVEVTGNTSVTAGEGNSTSFTCTVSGHPKPVVSWIFSGGSLSFGDRIVKNEESLDDYSLRSTLIINHLTVNDEGDYICSAKNDNGTSSFTFKLSVTGDPPSVTNLTLTPLNNTSAILTWSTNEQPNCVSFYTIELDSENSTFLYNTSNSTPQQIISDLMNGQTYNMTVTAIDVIGTSGNRSIPLLYHWNVPSSVNAISAVYIQEINTIVLNWNYSSDNTHPPVLYYAVEHNITGSGEVIFPTDTNVSIMISMLNEETIFSISIAAVNIIGIGPYLHENVIIVISPTTSSIGVSSSDVASQIHTGIITTDTLSSSLMKLTSSAVSSTSTSSIQPSNTVCDTSQCSISTPIAVAVPVTAVISSLLTGIITFLITCIVMRRRDSKESHKIKLKPIGGGPVYDTPQWNINQDNEVHVETNKAYGQII